MAVVADATHEQAVRFHDPRRVRAVEKRGRIPEPRHFRVGVRQPRRPAHPGEPAGGSFAAGDLPLIPRQVKAAAPAGAGLDLDEPRRRGHFKRQDIIAGGDIDPRDEGDVLCEAPGPGAACLPA
jgi:hypothetical protein